MAELTKEEQIQAIYDLKVGYTLGHADIAILKSMARQMLAGMEQEPVYQACKEAGVWVDIEPGEIFSLRANGEQVRQFYAAPQLPQPVVPDEWRMMCGEWRDETVSIHDASGLIVSGISPNAAGIIIEAHNASSAAMLQGAEPVQGWIPCSERMPEEIGRYWCYVEEQNSLGKSHYQWNCSWNGDRWWVESENGGRVTHWMPLQAAPQQEVKSGR